MACMNKSYLPYLIGGIALGFSSALLLIGVLTIGLDSWRAWRWNNSYTYRNRRIARYEIGVYKAEC